MTLPKREFDAVVVGSGPNGLAAAITMQRAGLSVLMLESKEEVGGGLRSGELTLPGFTHDTCSAIHPLALASPFFTQLSLKEHGLDFINPILAAAHPFDDGKAAILEHAVENTARCLRKDEKHYVNLMKSLVNDWKYVVQDILGPLRYPSNPIALARFGSKAIFPATLLARKFSTREGRALFAGMASHSMLPLNFPASSAIALVLLACGHTKGWPVSRGGSQAIANAMANYFKFIGGSIRTNTHVKSLNDVPSCHSVLFDIGPRQLLQIAGHKFSSIYTSQLQRFRYGMGVFKIDWALDGQIPFTAHECRMAGTVHIGGTIEEIAHAEKMAWKGKHSDRPFILLAQQSLFDQSRAPEGKHTAWAYCHVPNNSTVDLTETIENQIQRFAPGFRDRIIGRHTMNSVQFEQYNPNYVGGDINGGAFTLSQMFTRPALRLSPYRTSSKGLYLCSASTPPGGGVHGMCGYYAAKQALKDIFHIRLQH